MRSYLLRFLVALTGLALCAAAVSALADESAPAATHGTRVRSLPRSAVPSIDVPAYVWGTW